MVRSCFTESLSRAAGVHARCLNSTVYNSTRNSQRYRHENTASKECRRIAEEVY